MTSCIEVQKQQVQQLKELFPVNHQQFQIITASLDEISCRFVIDEEIKFDFLIDFPPNYPIKPPLWSIQIENEKIQQVLDSLNRTTGRNNEIKYQIMLFVEKMCEEFSLQLPENELKRLRNQNITTADGDIISISSTSSSKPNNNDDSSSSESSSSSLDDFNESLILSDTESGENNEDVLKFFKSTKQAASELEPNAKKTRIATSRNANIRIMEELKAIAKNKENNKKFFAVELVDDSLYEWNIKLTSDAFDNDSPIYQDLINLKKIDKDYVMLHVQFNESYPFEPPFIRVVEPMIIGGHIETGGALCMEVVMHRGWSPAYSMESLFLQIASTISRGGGRIDLSRNNYNMETARQKFKWLEKYYDPKSQQGQHWNLDKTG